ncbi:MAG TPA: MaoC family dehydratase N-terminal domain-containing protein [Lichenihabitans sp.]|jgi:3-methylfumaryl-CoA hydratase|nr:MaoC family dehydratase N-terminal domain-containing protein [Lichenihabitans sp.]
MSSDPDALDLGALKAWIGRRETATDIVTPRLDASLRAVFDRPPGEPAAGDPATPTIHWCLTPAIARMSELGEDGHPRRGGFLPPVPLPRRMWAGGELTMTDPLRVGDTVTRQSRIEAVEAKTGRSGPLCFVTVRHLYSTGRGPAIEERQDIVYRGESPNGAGAPAAPASVPPGAERQRGFPCDPVLLFRYSALTFNGHRIHYDLDYAMRQESYPGLVVHGPLQAAALIGFAADIHGAVPRTFSFRGVSPLIAGVSVTLNAASDADGLRLWASDVERRVTMQAAARWS